ncbi:MFS transporter [Pseudomonas sp. GV071]|uniref:MFS transporter n=1 Tax=Pseudomonas sp. GV071 TaxID=2135754 RepID=UPI000D347D10|nr:MFS transporter [Pseudomonas sp. GV071]PTQ68520.1 fucose permease [Pseudomonas sp. GV071]
MSALETPFATPSHARQKSSTRWAFFIAGFAMAAWAPLVPFAKARAALSEGSLGMLLLCLGAGSLLTMPLAGALASRFGCRRVIVAASLAVCLVLPLLTVFSSWLSLAVALALFGAGLGCLDCTINLQAVMVEKNSDTPLMSGFHGLFSVGGIAGAAGVSLLLAVGASPLLAALAVVACIVAVLLKTTPDLLPYGSASQGPAFAVPHGVVLMIGVICFILFLAEGAMLDWSAVFLVESKQLASAHSGIGYVAFACTMTIGRLTGDAVVHKVGRRRVVLLGALTAAAGLLLATWSDSWPLALVGFMLVGAGCSNVVPVMFSLIGKQKVMAEHVAIPAVSTLGYGGILLGPAIIGFIAHGSSLAVALLVLALMLVGAGLLSLTMKLGD